MLNVQWLPCPYTTPSLLSFENWYSYRFSDTAVQQNIETTSFLLSAEQLAWPLFARLSAIVQKYCECVASHAADSRLQQPASGRCQHILIMNPSTRTQTRVTAKQKDPKILVSSASLHSGPLLCPQRSSPAPIFARRRCGKPLFERKRNFGDLLGHDK